MEYLGLLERERRRKISEQLDPYLGNDAQVLTDNNTYYMTTTQCFDREFTDGKGASVYDARNKPYVDFCSRVGSSNLGHNNPELNGAAIEFIKRYGFAGPVPHHEAPNRFTVALAKKLCECMPTDFAWQCFFANGGTEAVEAALKACVDYDLRRGGKRTSLLTFHGAFNGRTLGALSTNANPVHREGYPIAFTGVGRTVYKLPYPAVHPYFRRGPQEQQDLSHITPQKYTERYLSVVDDYARGEILALIAEDGVQGEGGMNVGNPAILRHIFTWCRERGILVVHDAVQSGIGRTGKLFAFEHDGFIPDVLTLGKSLGAGLPLSAMICKKEIAFQKNGRHSNTNGGNPLACRVGLEVLRIIERRGILERVVNLAHQVLTPALEDIAKSFDSVHSVRNLGLMGGIEFWNPKTRLANPALRDSVIARGLDNGLLLLGCGASGIRIMPPLIISPTCLTSALRRLKYCISLACQEGLRAPAL